MVVILLALLVIVIVITVKDKVGDNDETKSYHQKMLKVIDEVDLTNLETKMKGIKVALDAYYMDYNEYPEILDMLVPDYARTEEVITDPWGTFFKMTTDDQMNLILISAGKDQIFGNQDDIKRRF